jgi:signal transduction histidine kinase/ActR/RegA family two-component response regulator
LRLQRIPSGITENKGTGMRTNILDQIVSFPKSILRTGIEDSTSREAEKNIIRLNLFLSFCLGISLINCIFNLANELFVSAVVNLAGTFLLTVAFYMNKDGQHEGSKKLGIITINLYLFCVSYVEGLRSGQYLLFFPLILALIFVIDLKRNLNEVIITSVVTLLTTAFIFILAPYQNTLQNIPQDLYSSLFSTNLAIALLLTTVFAYLILKTLENHEDKILEEKMLSDTIFDTSLDAVFIVRVSDLVITDCNKRALEVFRHDYKKSLIQIPVETLLGVQMRERISSIKSNGFIKGSPWYGNMDFEKQDDSLFYAYVNLVPFNHQNELYCKISILDITEIKVAEFEIIKAKERAEKAAKVKSRFLSNMSHELRTPLNAIIGTSNILLQEEYMESQREYFDVLKNSSEHMLQLVNDILDLSKLEAGKMELENVSFNLDEFLHKVVAPFNTVNNSDMKLEMDIDPVLNIEISGDQTRLQQVLNNLLSNAKKFTKSGKITVTARAESRKSQNVLVYFCVTDTGIGIPANKLKQVFDSFTQADTETTRKYGGTGLGLAISKYIVEKMGGELQVESEEGKGSSFYFSIDFKVNAKKAYVNEASLKELTGLAGLRILLAEDNPINMLVAKRFLQKWKLVVDEAVNGAEALELFKKNKYDLLLIDLEMPEMDGSEAVSHIRKIDMEVPIVAFTAAVYDDMQADLQRKGFTEFIPKPFRPEDLHKKILQLTAYDQLQKFKYG